MCSRFLVHVEYCQFCNGPWLVRNESENPGVKTYRYLGEVHVPDVVVDSHLATLINLPTLGRYMYFQFSM